MEVGAIFGGVDVTGANREISEFFAVEAFFGVAFEDRSEEPFDVFGGDVRFVEFREALAEEAAAEIDVVLAWGATDEADFGDVRASAAVGAASHADGDGVVAEAKLLERFFQLGDEVWEIAFGLGEGEPASWEGDAGERIEAHRAFEVGIGDSVLIQKGGDGGFLRGRNVRNHQVLVGGKAEITVVNFRDFAQTCAKWVGGRVEHAAARDVEREIEISVYVFRPAVAIAVVLEGVRSGSGKLVAEVFVHFGFEPIETAGFDGVLEARKFAIDAVAVVALHEDDFFRDVDDLFGWAEADDVGEARESCLVAVGHAHAAARGDVVADDFSRVVGDGEEREVVGENIDVIGWRAGDGDFEFSRQIGFAVDGLDFLFRALDFFAIEPNFVIGARAWGEVIGELLRLLDDLGVVGGEVRVGVAHHVAVDVAAGSDGVHGGFVDRLDHFFQVGLDDAVDLEGLAGGNFDGAVSEVVGDVIDGDPLGRGGDAARDADARHERVGFFEAVFAAIGAEFAVILLVGAVEFDQLLIIFAEGAGGEVFEAFGESSTEVIAAGFNAFVGGKFGIAHEIKGGWGWCLD